MPERLGRLRWTLCVGTSPPGDAPQIHIVKVLAKDILVWHQLWRFFPSSCFVSRCLAPSFSIIDEMCWLQRRQLAQQLGFLRRAGLEKAPHGPHVRLKSGQSAWELTAVFEQFASLFDWFCGQCAVHRFTVCPASYKTICKDERIPRL